MNPKTVKPSRVSLKGAVARAGGAIQLAKALGISASAVRRWSRIPNKHVAQVAALSGLSVETLRPDLAADELKDK